MTNNYNSTIDTHNCFNLSLSQVKEVSLRLNLEILNTCKHNCDGCYVNKRNNFYTKKGIEKLYNFVENIKSNYILDTIFIGPTDLFSAKDTVKMLLDKSLYPLIEKPECLVFTTTLDLNELEQIKEVVSLLENNKPWNTKNIEIQIVVDYRKILNNDINYKNEVHHKLNILKNSSIEWEYYFLMNISHIQKDIDLVEVSKIAKEEFDTILEFNPSFSRKIDNFENLKEEFHHWAEFLENEYNKNNDFINIVNYTQADIGHGGYAETLVHFHNDNLYLAPFIYENLFSTNKNFLISNEGSNYFDNYLDKIGKNIKEQYKKLKNFEECKNCQHNDICISKQTLQYMDTYNIKKCPFSKVLTEVYNKGI